MTGTVRQVHYTVEGLDCPSCAATLERACRGLPGVLRATASVTGGRLSVTAGDGFDPRLLREAARRAGHPLGGDADSAAWQAWLPAAVGAAVLALGIGLQAIGQPARWIYLVAAVIGGAPLPARALKALRQRNLDIHILMTLALVGALALGDTLEAALLTVLFAVARGLERGSLASTRRAVESLLELAPRTARVEREDAVVEVAAEQVAVGERLRLRPGDRAPLDGVIAEGRSLFDEAAVTGESAPVGKGPGDQVFAATIALDGAVTVAVTRPAGESTLARVVELVRRAEEQPAPLARQVDRFAALYTPAVTVGAALMAVLPGLLGGDWSEWIYRALVVLVLACPCALVLATPAAIFSGLTAAARRGILIRGGETLERLAHAATIAFDKTGTLTIGRPTVTQVLSLGEQTTERVLAIAAGLEAESTHPLAQAIRAASPSPAGVTGHRAEPGLGVIGLVDSTEYRLGSPLWLKDLGYAIDEAALSEIENRGETAVALASERVEALIALADAVRPEAVTAMADLKHDGRYRLVVLTGDNPRSAGALAGRLGLTDVRAGLLPEDKQRAVAELRAAGPVVMVGDGINDAPALAAADVGVALGAAGSDIALETAGVALMADDLTALPRLLRLAGAVRRTIIANIAGVLALRLVLFPLAATGHAELWLAVLADCGSAVLVTANSLRLVRLREREPATQE